MSVEAEAARWEASRRAEEEARHDLVDAIRETLRDGATKSAVCEEIGIARTTLNRWLAGV